MCFSRAQLSEAVSLYRGRVHDEDSDQLKGMLKQTAFRQACPLDGEQAKAVLENLLIADMESLFEPQPVFWRMRTLLPLRVSLMLTLLLRYPILLSKSKSTFFHWTRA